jgi:O-methyltransferase
MMPRLTIDRRHLERRYAERLAAAVYPLYTSLLASPAVPFAHRPTRREARALIRKVRRVSKGVPSASHPLEHLAMIHRLLLVEPFVEGVVVECGSWKGASASSLSLAAAQTNRKLHVFDSFAGLPEVAEADKRHVLLDRPEVHTYEPGMFAGALDEVRDNIARFGAIDHCTFHPGIFSDTMPGWDTPVVLAFLDVDLRDAIEDCLRALWPKLADGCAVFVHEAPHHEIASLFYDDAWWRENLDEIAPGLAGAGSGVGLQWMEGFWRSSLGFAIKHPATDSYHVRPPVDIA